MSAHYASWFPTVAAAVVMLFLGQRLTTPVAARPQGAVRSVRAPRSPRPHLSVRPRQDELTPSSRSVASKDSASSTD